MIVRPRIAFVVNGGPESAMAERAKSFADRLSHQFETKLFCRIGGKIAATRSIVSELFGFRPNVCYVLDLAAAGVVAAGLYRSLSSCPFILDTGDAVVELGRVLGRGPLGMLATRAMEAFASRAARHIVVRGSYHRELYAKRGVAATFIPDGVNVQRFDSRIGANDLSQGLIIGLVGSSVWIASRGTCYGWELVELVQQLRDRLTIPVQGILVGDGSGIEVLQRRASECGVADAIEFAGRVPHADLPYWIQKLHICISTQTNDVIGNVRTTGKLPLYLAAGRFVLATRVGEAARVLPERMLVDFAGESDLGFPVKLADRVSSLINAGEKFGYQPDNVRLAEQHFEYDRLILRVQNVLERVLGRERIS